MYASNSAFANSLESFIPAPNINFSINQSFNHHEPETNKLYINNPSPPPTATTKRKEKKKGVMQLQLEL
jgi:hypothetical protein